MSETIIIAGFPGSGKSYFKDQMTKEKPEMKILDISSFRFKYKITRNGARIKSSQFPENYIDYIKGHIGMYDIILIDSSPSIQEALRDSDIKYVLVVPYKNMGLMDYLKRYKKEKYGNRSRFIKNILIPDWEFVLSLVTDNSDVTKYYLTEKSPYLSNIIDEVIRIK